MPCWPCSAWSRRSWWSPRRPTPRGRRRSPGEHPASPYRSRCCGACTRPARCSSCRSSRSARSPPSTWSREQGRSTTAAGAFVAVIQIAGAVGALGSGGGRTGWAAGCARCASSRSAPRMVLLAVAPANRSAGWRPALVVGGVVRWRTTAWPSPPSPRSPGRPGGPGAGRAEHRPEHRRVRSPGRARCARRPGGFAVAFAVAALAPIAAIGLTPVGDEPDATGPRPPALVRSAATGPHPAARKV